MLDVADSPHRSEPDRDLWQLAGREGRMVLTRDLGFLWPSLRPHPLAVVIVRVPEEWQASEIAKVVKEAIQDADVVSWTGFVTLIEPGRTRQRLLVDISLGRDSG